MQIGKPTLGKPYALCRGMPFNPVIDSENLLITCFFLEGGFPKLDLHGIHCEPVPSLPKSLKIPCEEVFGPPKGLVRRCLGVQTQGTWKARECDLLGGPSYNRIHFLIPFTHNLPNFGVFEI